MQGKTCLENIILWGKTKNAGILQRISVLPWSHDTLLISGLCRLIYYLFIYLFREPVEKDQPRSRMEDCRTKIPYKTHR